MIERQTFGDRDAIVMYMDKDFKPVADRDKAELIKLTYEDNGESFWLVPKESVPAEDDSPEAEAAETYGGEPGEETTASDPVHEE